MIAHTDLPLLLLTRHTMATMIIISRRKLQTTIAATSPALRHTSEIERMMQRGRFNKGNESGAQTGDFFLKEEKQGGKDSF